MSGAKRRAESRNAMPVKSAVVVNTFRCPTTRACPNVESKKYFCPISQLKISRGPEAQACAPGFGGTSHGTAPTCGAPPMVSSTASTLPPPDDTVAVGAIGLTMIPEASVMRNRMASSTTAPAAGGVIGVYRTLMCAGVDDATPYQYGMRVVIPELVP